MNRQNGTIGLPGNAENIENMIIFVAGMPRSGSTWTYNVLRRMIELSGRKPVPEKIPPDQSALIGKAFSAPLQPGHVYCIKTHCSLPLDRPNVRIFCTYRDIRDATLSYMRFMKTSFERAIEVARGCMGITDYYLNSPNPRVYPVDYADVITCPDVLIGDMASFLGLDIGRQQIEEIVTAYSRENIIKSQNVARPGGKLDPRKLQEMEGKYMVRHGDGSFELYDPDTGLQSHHFTSIQEGEWRHAFTDEQLKLLNEITHDWLARYGYPVE